MRLMADLYRNGFHGVGLIPWKLAMGIDPTLKMKPPESKPLMALYRLLLGGHT